MLPLFLAVALLGQADTDPVPTPKGTPPTLLVGKIDAKGNFLAEVTVQKVVPVTKVELYTVNGRQEARKVTSYEVVTETVMHLRDLAKATATTAGGKKLDKDALAKRLAKKTAVVFSADGKPVDKGFLALFKSDTVVIVMPAATAADSPALPPRAKAPPVKD